MYYIVVSWLDADQTSLCLDINVFISLILSFQNLFQIIDEQQQLEITKT